MKVTDTTRRALRMRREMRDMPKDGWERISEGGGMLWELRRGFRYKHEITDVRIAADRKSLWVRVEDHSNRPDLYAHLVNGDGEAA